MTHCTSVTKIQPLCLPSLVLFCMLLTVASVAHAEEPRDCPFARHLDPKELKTIIDAHERWVNAKMSQEAHPSGQKANLCEAQLDGVNLSKKHLDEVNLSNAHLDRADLSEAILPDADLSGAQLGGADLKHVDLKGANLSGGAYLFAANLSEAHLSLANLNGADLGGANLEGADLKGADLSGANLRDADLRHVLFEPKSIPEPSALVGAEGLWAMTYSTSRHALVGLRDALQRAGMRQEEREVTYSLKRNDRMRMWEQNTLGDKIESIFNLVLFEWPSGYGMYPGRPLRILGVLIGLFSIPYMITVWRGKGIKAVWPTELVCDDDTNAEAGKAVVVNPLFFFPRLRRRFPGRLSGVLTTVVSGIVVGFYFSLLSAFHIGWRDLSLATWVSRVQPREYTLASTGWVRTVAGIQSILSVYLLALWVLTYFGRPFE